MPVSNRRNINKLLDTLEKQQADLHNITYHSSETNQQIFSKVSTDLTTSIKNAIEGDKDYQDLSNTTKLYEKVFSKMNRGSRNTPFFSDDTKESADNFTAMFQDPQLMGNLMETYANTKWIKILDDEIDMCLKYMPKLQTALNLKRDNVLCADSFNKTFISTAPANKLGEEADVKYAANEKRLMKLYDFEKKCEDWYDDASRYGEVFVYIVPYAKAFKQLLARKSNTQYSPRLESMILENGKLGEDYVDDFNKGKQKIKTSGYCEDGTIKLTMNRTGLLEDAINGVHTAIERLSKNPLCTSLYEEVLQEASGDPKYKEYKLDRTIDDVLTYEDDDSTAMDGLVGAKKSELNAKINTPGCVVKTLERSRVIPLYIEDICLGYYYINFSVDNLKDANSSAISDGYNSMTSMFNNTNQTDPDESGDMMLKYISGKISENIDSAFINANQDLREEIYMMLKYNDKFNRSANSIDVNVTYIPPEDIEHIRFNEDKKTHRGKSDLWYGLIAAKMWIMLNTTSVIGNVTRGSDRRVYYVKTMVETNVAKTLLNVISQIKKGNFGIRQMESINNILQVAGRFNDMVIPVGPSGDAPVTFDIMQGQQFELPVDLMNSLEDSAIGAVMPLEVVNSAYNMDFAIRYTMTNNRMLRDALKRQSIISKNYSRIFTKIYNCEYEENLTIDVKLPMPAFLMITQGSQLIQSATQYIDGISEVEMAGRSDEDRAMFKQIMLRRSLPGYMDMDMVDSVKKEMELVKSIDKTESEINSSDDV